MLVLGGDRQRELGALALFHARRLHTLSINTSGVEEEAIVLDYATAPLIISSGAVGEGDLDAAVAMATALEGRQEQQQHVERVQELRAWVTFDRRAVCTGESEPRGIGVDSTT